MAWTLADIRSRVRDLTGRPDEVHLSSDDLDEYINNYYQDHLPDELQLEDLDTWFEMDLEQGVGEVALDDDMRAISTPIFVDGYKANFHTDPDYFYGLYPKYAEATAEQSRPTDVLLYDRTLYFRPEPDDTYTIRVRVTKRPTALSETSDTPEDRAWGQLVAYGAAIQILIDSMDIESAKELSAGYNYHKRLISKRQILQYSGNTRSVPRF